MVQLFFAAFMIGIVGSFHCVGMCGPLALSLPLASNTTAAKLSGALIYNLGRITTYSVFGIAFGLMGQTASLFGFQQWLAIITGTVILFFILMPKKYKMQSFTSRYTNTFFAGLRSRLAILFKKRSYNSLYIIGLLNGLLPCGLVYLAIAGAIAAGTVANSLLFMVAFGFGTLPVMWSLAFFGNYIGISVRQKIRRIYPYMMALVGCLLILRGMGLGIPYISPVMNVKNIEVHGCCAKPDQSQALK